MKADEQLSKKFKEAPPNLAPGQIAWLIEQYCVALERLDMSDCPSDFRVAYKQHMRAWREAHVAVNEIPDGFVDGLVVGFMNGLVRGERDGGLGRMESKLRNAEDRIRTTWEVVERIAGQYGAVL
jgi:hypothetical protein